MRRDSPPPAKFKAIFLKKFRRCSGEHDDDDNDDDLDVFL